MAAKVKALTGEGRMQALVLLVLPPAILAAMAVLNPTYTKALFDRPELLAGMAVSELLGALFIRKIVNFDV
jgi:tight adherence protein B